MKVDLWTPEPDRQRGGCAPSQTRGISNPGRAKPDVGNNRIKFGRHKGKTIRQVFREDPGYLRWIIREQIGGLIVCRDVELFLRELR